MKRAKVIEPLFRITRSIIFGNEFNSGQVVRI
jgi:hypothetical protein